MSEMVSVIIPVYNCEKKIKETIQNIEEQTYQNLEIIIINDGSTDSTMTVLQEVSKKDSRIHVLQQENQGVSVARNTGIKYSHGKYLIFIDADDRISADMIQKMYKKAEENNSEVVICGFSVILERAKSSRTVNYGFQDYDLLLDNEIHKIFDRLANSKLLNVVWNKLILCQFIKDNNIFFETYSSGEDAIFSISLFKHVHRLSITGEYFYHYYQSSDGTLTTKFFEDKFDALLRYNILLQKLYKEWGILNHQTQENIDFILLRGILASFLSLANPCCNLKYLEKKKTIYKILHNKRVIIISHRLRNRKISINLLALIIRSRNAGMNFLLAKFIYFINKYFPHIIENRKIKNRGEK